MYYEESNVDGVLCFRSSPDGEWRPRGVASLTDQIINQQMRIGDLEDTQAKLVEKLKAVTHSLLELRQPQAFHHHEPVASALKLIGRIEGKSTFGFDWMDVLDDYEPAGKD